MDGGASPANVGSDAWHQERWNTDTLPGVRPVFLTLVLLYGFSMFQDILSYSEIDLWQLCSESNQTLVDPYIDPAMYKMNLQRKKKKKPQP